MRETPLVGTKPWFGPRDDGSGWGWISRSWEGHLTFGLFLAVILIGSIVADGRAFDLVGGGAAVGLVLVALLKGTSPGGRSASERKERNPAR